MELRIRKFEFEYGFEYENKKRQAPAHPYIRKEPDSALIILLN
jgi:hypothetical protein